MADSQPMPEEDLAAGDAEEAQAELEISNEGSNKTNSDVEIDSGNQDAAGADKAKNVTPSPEIREDVGTVGDTRSPENSPVLEDGLEAENATPIPERRENVDTVGDKCSPENSQVLPDGSEQAALSAESFHPDQDTKATNEDALKEATTDANGEPESNDLEDRGSTTEQKNEEPRAEIGDDEVEDAVAKTSSECGSPSTVLTNDPDKAEATGESTENGEPSQRDSDDAGDQVEERTDPELERASKEMANSQRNIEANETRGNAVKGELKSVVETALPGDALSEEKTSVPQPLVCENM